MDYRKSLMIGASALAVNAALTGAVMLVPERAYACTTISSDTVISDASSNCLTWNSSNLSISSAGTVAGANTALSITSNTVGNLINSGSLTGNSFGVHSANSSTIGTISNTGNINASGHSGLGIYLQSGSISSIANSGTITGYNGLETSGTTIGTISNTGTIEGMGLYGQGIANQNGNTSLINNSGTIIGGIDNYQGTIGGGLTAIVSTGTITGSIQNNFGAIVGDIDVNQNIIINGYQSTLTGGTITANNLNLAAHSAVQFMDDDINVGAGTVTNSGIIQVNATHSITGNFTQGSNASLIIGVSDSSHYGDLIISGNASLANDKISIVSIAGSFSDGEVLTIAQAGGTTDFTGISARVGHGFLGNVSSIANSGFENLVVTLASCGQTISSDTTIGGTSCLVTWNNGNLSIAGGGSVIGLSTALINIGHSVGVLTNNGTISGSNLIGGIGIFNTIGTIASINNNGTISGGTIGLYNYNGTIGTITNTGVLIGSRGLITYGSIGGIVNSGTISGNGTGIANNSGTIASITNTGTISSNNGNVIYNGGLIGGGATAINSTGTIIGMLYNAGTISGNFNANQTLSITGGGTLTGGTLAANNLVFASGYSAQKLEENVIVGSGSGTVTNTGSLQINSAAQSIAGDYAQRSTTAWFISGVSDSAHYGDLIVSGNATMTNNQVSIASIGGTLTDGEIFTIVQDGGTADFSGITAKVGHGFSGNVSSIANSGFENLVVTLSACINPTISSDTIFSSTACQIVWNSSNLSIASGGSVVGSTTAIVNSGNTVGTLTNNGQISGYNVGFNNSGSVSAISNGGSINGGYTGVLNAGIIGTISNSGTINGNSNGIRLNSGTIGTILNNVGGTISGGTSNGIIIYYGGGSIGAITNNGDIIGHYNGILNKIGGHIGTITNNGIISGNSFGIFNESSGSTLTAIINTGTISGLHGIFNDGGSPLGGGVTAILSTGTIIGGLLNNGTIVGNINVNQDLSISGGYAWSNGTLAGGTITANNLAFTNGAYQELSSDIAVGSGVGTVSNAASLRVDATQSITGNYAQSGTGQLVIGTADSAHYGKLVISGTANIVNGFISIVGSNLTNGETFTVAQATASGTDYASVSAVATGWLATPSSIISSGLDSLIISLSTCANATINSDTSFGSAVCSLIWNGGNLSITNAGTIAGSNTAIINSGQSVGTLTNDGVIGGNTYGLNNSGTIPALANASTGIISGGQTGIWNNAGFIGVLTNSGTIFGNNQAINNTGSIGTINNSGSITSHSEGINNVAGVIDTIVNVGTINGNFDGIGNNGTIGTITNSGLIAAQYALYSANSGGIIGTIQGAITNSGTMSGNIYALQDLTFTGGSSGALGTLTGYQNSIGTITTGGHNVIFDNAAFQLLNDDVLMGGGIMSIAGTVRVNAAHSITGNYVQDSGATLILGATNSTHYGDLIISGNATMTNDLVSIAGSGFTIGETFTIVQDAGVSDYTGITALAGGFTTSISSIAASGFEDLLVTLSSCTNQTISGDTTFSSSTCGLVWQGGNLSITSIGVVSGSATAILNSGNSVGSLTNDGIIDGTNYGLINTGTLIAVTNAGGGILSGGVFGVFNNAGTIGAITNNGTLSGTYDAILNFGTIGAIQNNAVITSTRTGIANDANVINTITNSGTISGRSFALANDGSSIGSVVNSGTISNIISCTFCAAIANFGGTIGTITNTGLISGPVALLSANSGTITSTIQGPLTNSGTIAGNINVNQDLTFTGGNASTIGTLTGFGTVTGTIVANNLTFDSAAYQLLDDAINVGSGTVTNSGTLMVKAAHSITGNYAQGSSALLLMGVIDPTHYGQLVISGNATMSNDQISITALSGSLTNGETFTIVKDAGTFDYSGITATATGFTTSISSISNSGFEDLIIALSGGGGGGGGTYNSIGNTTGGGVAAGMGSALDQILANGDPAFNPIFTALNNLGSISQASEGAGIKQLGPNQIAPQLIASDSLMDLGADAITQHEEFLASNNKGTPLTGAAAGSEYHSGIFWGQMSGGAASKSSTATLGGYNQINYGMSVGSDLLLDKSTTLGLAFGWMHGNAWGKDDLSGTHVSVNSFQFMGYGTKRFGPASIDGLLGLGYNRFSQSRNISFLGTSASADYSGMAYMAKVTGGWDFTLPRTITLTPLIGFQAVHSDNNGYSESGAGVADLTVKDQIVNSYATTLGAKASRSIPTAWGDLKPEVKLAWVHDLNGNPIPTNGTLGGVSFTTTTPRVSQDGAQLMLGFTLLQGNTLSLKAEYNGDLRADYQSHSGLVKMLWDY